MFYRIHFNVSIIFKVFENCNHPKCQETIRSNGRYYITCYAHRNSIYEYSLEFSIHATPFTVCHPPLIAHRSSWMCQNQTLLLFAIETNCTHTHDIQSTHKHVVRFKVLDLLFLMLQMKDLGFFPHYNHVKSTHFTNFNVISIGFNVQHIA